MLLAAGCLRSRQAACASNSQQGSRIGDGPMGERHLMQHNTASQYSSMVILMLVVLHC